MHDQIVAFAGLFRVCARALRKLSLKGYSAADTTVLFDVADQLEILAAKLEKHLEDADRAI